MPSQAYSAWSVGTPIVTYFTADVWFSGGYYAYGSQFTKLTPAIAQQAVAGGFNLVWINDVSQLAIAEQYGLRGEMVISGHQPQNSWFFTSESNWPDPAYKPAMDAMIDAFKASPAAYSYFIIDEPIADRFAHFGAIVDYLQQRDPEHLSYINLLPPDAPPEYSGTPDYTTHLNEFISTVNPSLLSYDSYDFMYRTDANGNPTTTPYNRSSYFTNLVVFSNKSKATGIPFINVVQGCNWGVPWRVPTADELRFLNYTTLAYGAQGISYFNYWTPTGPSAGGLAPFPGGVPTSVYTALQTINPEFVAVGKCTQQLNWIGTYVKGYFPGFAPPGLTPLPSTPFSITGLTDSRIYHDGDAPKGVMFGLFDTDGTMLADATFALVTNLDYSASHTYTVTGPGNLSTLDATTGIWTATGHNYAALSLLPGGGILVGLTAEVTVPVFWTGSATTTWSAVVGSGNWKRSSGATGDYSDGADVTFDDSATGITTINLSAANVTPNSVTFNNSSKTYTVGGSFGIAGATGVLKQGTGTVTLNGVNIYTGTTTVQGGTLELGVSAQAPVLVNAGGADIQGGKLILDYTGAAPDVYTSLKASFDAGWVTGRIRDTAAAVTRLILGWKDDAGATGHRHGHLARRRRLERFGHGSRPLIAVVEVQYGRHVERRRF